MSKSYEELASRPIFFERNRVFRIYQGGALFHPLFGDPAADNNHPEEWIASSVKALNKIPEGEHEGVSRVAGTAALEDETYFQTCCASICQSRAWAAGELERLGFTVLPSRANFLFVRSPKIGGEDLYRSLKENGILVRWFDSPRIRDFVRITVGDLEQMHTLIDQVEQLLDAL